jgi:hypothetical protein
MPNDRFELFITDDATRDVKPDFRPPVWGISRGCHTHGGPDAPEVFMSDIGGLLPMAL